MRRTTRTSSGALEPCAPCFSPIASLGYTAYEFARPAQLLSAAGDQRDNHKLQRFLVRTGPQPPVNR